MYEGSEREGLCSQGEKRKVFISPLNSIINLWRYSVSSFLKAIYMGPVSVLGTLLWYQGWFRVEFALTVLILQSHHRPFSLGRVNSRKFFYPQHPA